MFAGAFEPRLAATISVGGVPQAVRVQSPPPERLARQPMLLFYLSADRASSMPDGRYGAPGQTFLEQGNRILSFDLPAHGDRVDVHGSGIAGLAALVAAGKKPFDCQRPNVSRLKRVV